MRLLLASFVVVCYALAFGQGLTSEGREFYLGHIRASHTDVLTGPAAGQVRVYALISSYTDNEVSVSYFNPATGIEGPATTYTIAANRTKEILLDQILMRPTEPGDNAEYRSCHIVSKDPVAVHYYANGACASGAYLALQVGTWGKEYVVATEQDNPGVGAWVNPPSIASADNSNGCFMVIAAENNTNVTISPNARTGGGHAGATQGQGATGKPQPYQVLLQRGQIYFVRSLSAQNGDVDDMSGSIVTSDRPVAVIMAHENATVGDGLVRETSQTDARDFMIEQAIPWEYASSTGNATVPMQDSQGLLEGGEGEDVKVFVAATDAAQTVNVFGSNGIVGSYNVSPYSLPPPTRNNVIAPLEFSCDSGKRMQVVQYELRSDGGGTPFTAPAMMNIIPFNCWRNAYLWYVPKKVPVQGQTPYEEYYVTILAYGAVNLSIDGGNAEEIGQALGSIVKSWQNIPNLPPLPMNSYSRIVAKTYRMSAGVTYYARSEYPFMVYVFGYVGTDDPPNRPTYSGFAYPAGMRGSTTRKGRIGLQVKEECTSWTVCATDSNGIPLNDITLYIDPNGNFLGEIDGHKISHPYSSTNCTIVERRLGEDLSCIKVSVIDTTRNATASIIVTDAAGNLKASRLWYTGQKLVADPEFSGFGNVRVGDTVMRKLVLRSPNTFAISKIAFSDPESYIIPSSLRFPITLGRWDSLVVELFYAPVDTMQSTGTITFSNSCHSVDLHFPAQGVTGLIMAKDQDFGTIKQGSGRCMDVRIDNYGSAPFNVVSGSISGSTEFSIDSIDKARLPVSVEPGKFVNVKVCYRPKDDLPDTASIFWTTDIHEPYTNSIKSTSMLYGQGVQLGILTPDRYPITLQPNPGNGTFYLDLQGLDEGLATIALFNTLGAECYRATGRSGSMVELQVPQLAPGNYIVKVVTGSGTYDLRLIQQ